MAKQVIKLDKPELYNVACTEAKEMCKYVYQYFFSGYILKVKQEDNGAMVNDRNGKYFTWILN